MICESEPVTPPTIENFSSSPPGKSGCETDPEIVIPSKPFFVITLITPPIASEPYTADAPSARISTLSTAAVGNMLMLADEPPSFGEAGILLPSIRTRVLSAPNPLKLI